MWAVSKVFTPNSSARWINATASSAGSCVSHFTPPRVNTLACQPVLPSRRVGMGAVMTMQDPLSTAGSGKSRLSRKAILSNRVLLSKSPLVYRRSLGFVFSESSWSPNHTRNSVATFMGGLPPALALKPLDGRHVGGERVCRDCRRGQLVAANKRRSLHLEVVPHRHQPGEV